MSNTIEAYTEYVNVGWVRRMVKALDKTDHIFLGDELEYVSDEEILEIVTKHVGGELLADAGLEIKTVVINEVTRLEKDRSCADAVAEIEAVNEFWRKQEEVDA